MALRTKIGGTGGGYWRDVPTGGLKIKSGGGWVGASKVSVKVGAPGGGYWKDSGYIGYPNPPTNFYVSGWNFSKVYLHWDGPVAGGAPVDHYRVVMTNSGGGWMEAYNTTVNDSINIPGNPFNVAEDYRVQFFVQSVSAANLESGWVGPIKVQIGHTELSHPEPYTYTQDWHSGAVGVNLYNGGASGPQVPGNVDVWGMYVNLSQAGLCNGQTWSYLSPGSQTTRDIFFVTAGNIRYDLGRITLGNPSHGWLYISGNGGNNGWGLVGIGGGFASGPATSNCRVVGDLDVYGVGTYSATRTIIDRPRAENSYW